MRTPLSWILLLPLLLGSPLVQVSKRKNRPASEPKAVLELRKKLEDANQQLSSCQTDIAHLNDDMKIQALAYQRAARAETDWISFRKQFGWEETGGPWPIRIVTEPITGGELYKDAAMRMIASRFSKEIAPDSRALWTLTVGGTNLNASTQAQYVEVELSYPLRLTFAQSELNGRMRVASDAAMFTRYTERARVQATEEMITRVLTQAIDQRKSKATTK